MPYYGPHEDYHIILFERTFLAGLFVHGVGYGVQLVLYVMCARYFWRERKRRGGVMLFLLAYVTLLLILLSSLVAVVTWALEEMFINNRNYPGGPWAYFNSTHILPITAIYFAIAFSLTFLSDLLVLWRCWVIWTSAFIPRLVTYAVLFFPLVLLLASFVLGIIWCQQSSAGGHPFYNETAIILTTSYYATSVGMNVVVTFLITLRLCLHRHKMLDTLSPDHAKQYLSLVAILVESAALYSVVALAFIISKYLRSPMNPIFMALSPSCQVCFRPC
ncbi:hypothetical protein M378DRAFT_168282 [Amanita muscaria Koide BX008]|uniref:Uncharacterized protein n=1 Tax=Amanita muscaria (strain Koide BX008) TaxID=946122 RepID=A0A0C2T1D6_AMAMK|nr:hypothetical protein M378DRAFT_168282 [Amanita muscaria Koide BX008]